MAVRNVIGDLRMVGLAEGASFLALLLIAMPLKYLAGWPLAVQITGSVHGGLFLLYVLATWRAARARHWSWPKSIRVLLASLIPLGPFLLEGSLRREEQELLAERRLLSPVETP